jgi:putative SOS response-associated peptidase YedK
MCGRYAFFAAHEAIARLFGVLDAPPIDARYNIAPTQFVPVVRSDSEGVRRLAMLYWGLLPPWAKEKSLGARMINARAETAREKPAFRAAYRKRRCLVLASGWYEWQRTSGAKQPFFLRQADAEPFGMAGLWESWVERAGEPPLESCTILTGAPDPALAFIHDRMPVIIAPHNYGRWLDRRLEDADVLDAIVAERPSGPLAAQPVSRAVNSARNEGPELIEPAPS